MLTRARAVDDQGLTHRAQSVNIRCSSRAALRRSQAVAGTSSRRQTGRYCLSSLPGEQACLDSVYGDVQAAGHANPAPGGDPGTGDRGGRHGHPTECAVWPLEGASSGGAAYPSRVDAPEAAAILGRPWEWFVTPYREAWSCRWVRSSRSNHQVGHYSPQRTCLFWSIDATGRVCNGCCACQILVTPLACGPRQEVLNEPVFGRRSWYARPRASHRPLRETACGHSRGLTRQLTGLMSPSGSTAKPRHS